MDKYTKIIADNTDNATDLDKLADAALADALEILREAKKTSIDRLVDALDDLANALELWMTLPTNREAEK